MRKQNSVNTILSLAVLALSSGIATNAEAGRLPMERCADIAKTGKNACDANGHSCAGQSTVDNQLNEWIKTPKGTCSNIVTICSTEQPSFEGVSAKKANRICSKVAKQTDAKISGGRVVE